MRWQHGAQQDGNPDYCKTWCGRRFGASTSNKCSACSEPPLWRENLEAVELFNSCWCQRNTNREGVLIGFDYQTVHAVMQMLGIKGAEAFRKFRAVERELIDYFGERAAKQT